LLQIRAPDSATDQHLTQDNEGDEFTLMPPIVHQGPGVLVTVRIGSPWRRRQRRAPSCR